MNMASAIQMKSGSWRCQVAFTDCEGKKHRESFVEETAELAEAKAAMWKAGMLVKNKECARLTFAKAAEEYIDSCRVAGIKTTTINGYVSMKNNAFTALPRIPIDKLTIRDVQKWINVRAREASPKTVQNNKNFLSAVLHANGLSLDMKALKLPRNERAEMEIPSDEQVAQLLEYVYDDDDLYIAVSLAAIMGLRRSEICALRWSDITVEDDVAVLHVNKALVKDEGYGGYVEAETKTSSGTRSLIIPDALYAELKRRRQLRPCLVAVTPDALTNRYALRVEKLGMPKRLHSLRHYHASVMLREGVPEKYIVADMGHSSFEMVKRVYGHVMQEKRGVINEAMNSHATAILGRPHDRPHDLKKAR